MSLEQVRKGYRKKSPDTAAGTLYQQNNKTTKEALLQAQEGLTVGSRVFDVEKNKLYLNWHSYTPSCAVLLHERGLISC